MCYYSTTMRGTRDAKEQEDLVVGAHDGHHVLKGTNDKTVCVMNDATIHIEELKLSPQGNMVDLGNKLLFRRLRKHLGKPVSAQFVEYNATQRRLGYASDAVLIDGVKVHLMWLAEGTKCYIGAKKASLETKLGVDDPSIILDHGPQKDAPTHREMLAKIDGLCSITR